MKHSEDLSKIKIIAKVDKKLNAFKRLCAYTVNTLVISSPIIATASLAIHGVQWPLPLSIPLSLGAALYSLMLNNSDKNNILKYINSDYWKNFLNLPAAKLIKNEEAKIIRQLKQGVSDEQLVKLHVSLLINTPVAWYLKHLKEAHFERHDYFLTAQPLAIRRNNSYDSFTFMTHSDRDFCINNIARVVADRIEQIDKKRLAQLMQEEISIKYDSIQLNLIENSTLDAYINEIILLSGGYKELKKSDYKQITTLIVGGNMQILSLLKAASDMRSTYIDWVKIKTIIQNNYKNIDAAYQHWSCIIDSEIAKSVSDITNNSILDKIQNNRQNNKAHTSGQAECDSVVELVNLNSLFHYTPHLHAQLWCELVNNCKNIQANKNRLTHQDMVEFNEKIESLVPNIIMSDNYLKNLQTTTKASMIISQEIENNLREVIAISERIIESMEREVIKTLRVDKKYLQMKN